MAWGKICKLQNPYHKVIMLSKDLSWENECENRTNVRIWLLTNNEKPFESAALEFLQDLIFGLVGGYNKKIIC